jgi:hypothetical protein
MACTLLPVLNHCRETPVSDERECTPKSKRTFSGKSLQKATKSLLFLLYLLPISIMKRVITKYNLTGSGCKFDVIPSYLIRNIIIPAIIAGGSVSARMILADARPVFATILIIFAVAFFIIAIATSFFVFTRIYVAFTRTVFATASKGTDFVRPVFANAGAADVDTRIVFASVVHTNVDARIILTFMGYHPTRAKIIPALA